MLEYYTYTLPEDRTLQVKIKGIPEEDNIETIAKDLNNPGLYSLRITQKTCNVTTVTDFTMARRS